MSGDNGEVICENRTKYESRTTSIKKKNCGCEKEQEVGMAPIKGQAEMEGRRSQGKKKELLSATRRSSTSFYMRNLDTVGKKRRGRRKEKGTNAGASAACGKSLLEPTSRAAMRERMAQRGGK